MQSEIAHNRLGNSPFKPQASEDEPFETPWNERLGSFDVFSLIVNKMIGTGIYTSPAVVYQLTGSKSITLALFGVGFLYCLISTAIYLQYAEVLPYNGGELVYLDEITASDTPTAIDTARDEAPHQDGTELHNQTQAQQAPVPSPSEPQPAPWYRQLLGDGLLAHIIYSLTFIIFFNSATNSQQFGRMVQLYNHADAVDIDGEIQKDQHLIRYIAVSVLSIICLIQFFSARFGRRLNRFLAVVKIGFLIGLIGVGLSALDRDLYHGDKNPPSRTEDWSVQHEVHSKVSFAKALLVVLFSFEGWENATFVAGEIPQDKHKVLRRGFLTAACTVGSLYLIVVAVSLNSLEWKDVEKGINTNYAPMLTGDTTKARRTWAVIISISAFGSLNAIIYTFSRVKQVIGQAEVLPWSRFLKQDDCLNRRQRPEENAFHYKSPQGGLIAHWSASVVLIAASASIEHTLDSIGLAGYIQTYTHCFILMVLGIGYLRLKSRQDSLKPSEGRGKPLSLPERFFEALVLVSVPIYVLLNLAIIVINAVPPYKSPGDKKSVFPGYAFLVIVAGLVTVGTIYYLLFFGAVCRSYEVVPSDEESEDERPRSRVVEKGILKPTNPSNLMKYAGVACEMEKDHSYNRNIERVFRFGRRWRLRYTLVGYDNKVCGQVPLHDINLTQKQNSDPSTSDGSSESSTSDEQGLTFAMVLYWTFGGSRLKEDQTPWAKLKERTERLFSW
uniref:WGS project CBMI000000000 data, contig CS3069_c002912 n=1 Tax=Fusarium clavum TaxID=2594811 RepID=A0A090MJA3_9HYPO|nr:unnamed protein product [Fusarium clavum]